MANDKVQINKIGLTSALEDSDVFVLEQKAGSKYITRSVTLEELADYIGTSGSGGGGGSKKVKAADVSYDNTTSELDATNVQTAVDVLAEKLRAFSGIGFASLEVDIQEAIIEDVHPVNEE